MVNNRDREVQIDVTSRHQHVSEKTRSYAMEKAQKLTKFNSRIARIQVVLDEAHDEFITEMVVHVESGGTVVGKESASGYRASIDTVSEKLGRQLKKDKEKRRNHKHDPIAGQLDPASADGEPEPTFDDVVREDLAK